MIILQYYGVENKNMLLTTGVDRLLYRSRIEAMRRQRRQRRFDETERVVEKF